MNQFFKHLKDNTKLGSDKQRKPHMPPPKVPVVAMLVEKMDKMMKPLPPIGRKLPPATIVPKI